MGHSLFAHIHTTIEKQQKCTKYTKEECAAPNAVQCLRWLLLLIRFSSQYNSSTINCVRNLCQKCICFADGRTSFVFSRHLRHINDGFVCIFDFALVGRVVTSLQNKLHATLFILLPILGQSTIKKPFRLHFFFCCKSKTDLLLQRLQ